MVHFMREYEKLIYIPIISFICHLEHSLFVEKKHWTHSDKFYFNKSKL